MYMYNIDVCSHINCINQFSVNHINDKQLTVVHYFI